MMSSAPIASENAKGAYAATSAAAVANEFLMLGLNEPTAPPIDQMKLQKLLFYAHAWHLAIKGRPLFEEDFEAWSWGPVVRNIYFETRNFGRSKVTSELTELRKSGPTVMDFVFVTPHIEDEETRVFIRQIWDVHKNFTGIQLSNATHAPGEPWSIIKDQYGTLDHKPTIPNSLIQEVFKNKIANAANSAST